MTEIVFARDFSPTPGGRINQDGPFSGEAFRDRILTKAFRHADGQIIIVLDGVAGLPPSFLEEAFGGLVRKGIATAEEILRRVKFRASDANLSARFNMVERFVREAQLVST